jgi:ABC-type cobalt transport system substrate-binding protein
VLTVVIFAFLFVLLVAAIIVGVYLLNTTTFPFAGADEAATTAITFALRS